MSGISQFMFGKPGQFDQRSTLGAPQQPLFQDLMGSGQGSFSQVGDYYRNLLSGQGGDFEAMAAPQFRQFQQETVPGLAAQFAGLGSGATQSSGLRNAITQANTDLGERLGALRASLRMQGAQGLQGIGSQGLGNFYQNTYQPRTTGFLENLAPAIGSGIGMAAGGGMSGLSSILPMLQKLFQGQQQQNPGVG